MGRRSFWCEEDARKKRRERRLASGYISRAHEEEDSTRGKSNRLDETKNLQRQRVTLYTEYLVEENYETPGYVLKIGTPPPDITRIKDFIRWYIASAKDQGRLSADKKLTWIKKTLPADKSSKISKSRSSTLLEMIFETSSPPYGHGTVLSSFMAYLKSPLYSHCKYSSLLEQGSGLLYRMRNIRK
ncbi:hypothetical protein BJX63DRAFT_426349 [Aspergillus granulosus]|uniref:Uncharacterized protein n=1 Tax=Aspergillus granulosus TaxID=176169 RepID=A0ABR4GSK6_9EURO